MCQAALVAVALDGRAVVHGELPGVAQPAGQQEMEQRPQLAQVILQRRAGQAQAVVRAQVACGLGRLGGGVLDVLRLVEDQQVILVLPELLGIARQQGIGGEDQVVFGDLRERLAPARAVQREHAQVGGEAFGLVQPVGDQAGRHDHQCRAGQAPGLLLQQHEGEGLQRLAQAHVVGEDAAGADFAQRLHPAQALVLVGAQLGVEAGGNLCRLGTVVAQAMGDFAQLLAALPGQRQFLQLGKACGVRCAHAQTAHG